MSGRLRTYAPLRAKSRALPGKVLSQVDWRSDDRCEVVLVGLRCIRRRHDYHHVQKQSQGGPHTPDNVLAICREHHDRTDWPYKRGRLVIRPLGQGRFECAIVTASDKFAVR